MSVQSTVDMGAVKRLVAKGSGREVIAKELGISKSSARRAIDRLRAQGEGAAPAPAPAPSSARTLADFRRQEDQTWKIQDGLKRLFKGDTYMTDAEFREAIGGNPQRWRSAADATEFRENKFRYRGDVLWGSRETIAEMKQIVGMAI